jgi:phage terminase large subunit-like protein
MAHVSMARTPLAMAAVTAAGESLEVAAGGGDVADVVRRGLAVVGPPEHELREARRRWQVRELVADPFRWVRTVQLLDSEGLPVVEFPQIPARITPATTRFCEAVVNRALTHSGHPALDRYVANCTVKTDSRGTRLAKEHKYSTRRIDLAVAAVIAPDRATAHAGSRLLQVF